MATNKTQSINKQLSNPMHFASLVIYTLAIVVTLLLLVFEPNGFDASAVRTAIVALIAVLFISGLGIGHLIAGRSSSKLLSVSGTVALAVLLTLMGFFTVAAVGWMVGLSHA